MEQNTTIENAVRTFILEAFLVDQGDEELTSQTHLVEAGIVDSINVLQLVEFMEESYDVLIEPEDLFQLTSIDNITALIRSKNGF